MLQTQHEAEMNSIATKTAIMQQKKDSKENKAENFVATIKIAE